jgi:hypothetical protein
MIVPLDRNKLRLRSQGVATYFDLSANLRNIKNQRGPRRPSNFQERPIADLEHSFRPRSSSTPQPSPPKPLFDLPDYITPETSEDEEGVKNKIGEAKGIENENNESYFLFPKPPHVLKSCSKFIAGISRIQTPSAPRAFLVGDIPTVQKSPPPDTSFPTKQPESRHDKQQRNFSITRDPLPLPFGIKTSLLQQFMQASAVNSGPILTRTSG